MKDRKPVKASVKVISPAAARAAAEAGIAALEEERRLAYVAVTRAKEELFISSPARHRGKKAEVSRFMLAAFRSAARPQATAPVAGASSPGRMPVTRSSAPGSAAVRTHTVPVWKCTGKACPGWTRKKAGGAEEHLTSKPCPLCSSPMESSTREVPV